MTPLEKYKSFDKLTGITEEVRLSYKYAFALACQSILKGSNTRNSKREVSLTVHTDVWQVVELAKKDGAIQ